METSCICMDYRPCNANCYYDSKVLSKKQTSRSNTDSLFIMGPFCILFKSCDIYFKQVEKGET